MKRVHVAAAVIRGSDGRVLIARRPEDKHQGGLWEFPGGKVEDGEPVRAALPVSWKRNWASVSSGPGR